ncbi:MAG: hypothetical protein NTX64_15570, partial [Elusimicrobia bacterium]|nr:hypothetical protein [Elusimicrobiota bacterium]
MTPPVSSVLAPVANTFVTNLNTISGTSNADLSGAVARWLHVSISTNGNYYYWNGASWDFDNPGVVHDLPIKNVTGLEGKGVGTISWTYPGQTGDLPGQNSPTISTTTTPDGTTFYIALQAIDLAGNVETPATIYVQLDKGGAQCSISTPMAASPSFPAAASYGPSRGFAWDVQTTSVAIGSAYNYPAPISYVEVEISQDTNQLEWNGSGWVSYGGSPTNWNRATITSAWNTLGDGKLQWSYAMPPLWLTPDKRFTLRARAWDVVGNVPANTDARTFFYDATTPNSVILVPNGATYYPKGQPAVLSGTAFDPLPGSNSGLDTVQIEIVREDNLVWQGSNPDATGFGGYTPAVWRTVTLDTTTGVWNYPASSGLSPQGDTVPTWTSGHTYTVHTHAFDKSGNQESTDQTQQFTYEDQAPAVTPVHPGNQSFDKSVVTLIGPLSANVSGATRVQVALARNGAFWDPVNRTFGIECSVGCPTAWMDATMSSDKSSWSFTDLNLDTYFRNFAVAKPAQVFVYVAGTDAAGNVTRSTTTPQSGDGLDSPDSMFTIDRTPPSSGVTLPASSAVQSVGSQITGTAQDQANGSGIKTDPLNSTIYPVRLRISQVDSTGIRTYFDGNQFQPTEPSDPYQLTALLGANVAGGAPTTWSRGANDTDFPEGYLYTVQSRAHDDSDPVPLAPNTTAYNFETNPAAFSFIVDKTTPTAAFVVPAAGSVYINNTNFLISSGAFIDYLVPPGNIPSGVAEVDVQLADISAGGHSLFGGTTYWNAAQGLWQVDQTSNPVPSNMLYTSTWSFNLPSDWARGEGSAADGRQYVISVVAKDRAGNTGDFSAGTQVNSAVLTLDQTPPQSGVQTCGLDDTQVYPRACWTSDPSNNLTVTTVFGLTRITGTANDPLVSASSAGVKAAFIAIQDDPNNSQTHDSYVGQWWNGTSWVLSNTPVWLPVRCIDFAGLKCTSWSSNYTQTPVGMPTSSLNLLPDDGTYDIGIPTGSLSLLSYYIVMSSVTDNANNAPAANGFPDAGPPGGSPAYTRVQWTAPPGVSSISKPNKGKYYNSPSGGYSPPLYTPTNSIGVLSGNGNSKTAYVRVQLVRTDTSQCWGGHVPDVTDGGYYDWVPCLPVAVDAQDTSNFQPIGSTSTRNVPVSGAQFGFAWKYPADGSGESLPDFGPINGVKMILNVAAFNSVNLAETHPQTNWNFYVDTSAPVTTIASPADNSYLNANPTLTGFVSDQTPPTANGNPITDSAAGVNRVVMLLQAQNGPYAGLYWDTVNNVWSSNQAYSTVTYSAADHPSSVNASAWTFTSSTPTLTWQNDTQYTVDVKAVDNTEGGGNAEANHNPKTFTYVTTPPTIAITTPSFTLLNSLPTISGTASVIYPDVLGLVQVRIYRRADYNDLGYYANPAHWTQAGGMPFDTLDISQSELAWVNAASGSNWTTWSLSSGVVWGYNASTFTIEARAFDRAGNLSVYSTFTFVLDAVPPVSGVQFPINGSVVNTLSGIGISGTSSDLPDVSQSQGTIDQVEVQIIRLSDNNYWQGAGSWAPVYYAMPGTLADSYLPTDPDAVVVAPKATPLTSNTQNWNVQTGVPTCLDTNIADYTGLATGNNGVTCGPLTHGASYFVEARGYDNTTFPGTLLTHPGNTPNFDSFLTRCSTCGVVITVDLQPPSSSVTVPMNGQLFPAGSLGSIQGTALDDISGISGPGSIEVQIKEVSRDLQTTFGTWNGLVDNATFTATGDNWVSLLAIGGLFGSVPGNTTGYWSFPKPMYSFSQSIEAFQDQHSYRVFVRATDAAMPNGNLQEANPLLGTAISSMTFTIDNSAPAVQITYPVTKANWIAPNPNNGGFFNGVIPIRGRTSSSFGVKVASISLQDNSSNLYYDPAGPGFTSPSVVWIGTTLSSVTTQNFLFSLDLPKGTIPGTDGRDYTLNAVSINNAGAVGYPANATPIRYDTSFPTATVTAPADTVWSDVYRQWTGFVGPSGLVVAGAAADAGGSFASGVNGVQIQIQQGGGSCWSGADWSATCDWTNTTPNSSWIDLSYPFLAWSTASVYGAQLPPPNNTSGLQEGIIYTVRARAYDVASNTQTASAVSGNTFIYDQTPPTAHVTVPQNGTMYSYLPAIYGTATDNNNIAFPKVYIHNLQFDTYWDSVGQTFTPGQKYYLANSSTSGTALSWSLDTSTGTGLAVAWPPCKLNPSTNLGCVEVLVVLDDAAGNVSTTTLNFGFDNVPPSTVLTTPWANGIVFSSMTAIQGTAFSKYSPVTSVGIKMWYLFGGATYYYQPVSPHWAATNANQFYTFKYNVTSKAGDSAAFSYDAANDADLACGWPCGNPDFAWANGTHDLQDGKTFYVVTQALSGSGIYEQAVTTRTFTFVNTPPQSWPVIPADQQAYNNGAFGSNAQTLASVQGISSDPVAGVVPGPTVNTQGLRVTGVKVSISHQVGANSYQWYDPNGNGFSSNGEVWLDAQTPGGVGLAAWSYPQAGTVETFLQNGEHYVVKSSATDLAGGGFDDDGGVVGNVQTQVLQSKFLYDTIPPSSNVTEPDASQPTPGDLEFLRGAFSDPGFTNNVSIGINSSGSGVYPTSPWQLGKIEFQVFRDTASKMGTTFGVGSPDLATDQFGIRTGYYWSGSNWTAASATSGSSDPQNWVQVPLGGLIGNLDPAGYWEYDGLKCISGRPECWVHGDNYYVWVRATDNAGNLQPQNLINDGHKFTISANASQFGMTMSKSTCTAGETIQVTVIAQDATGARSASYRGTPTFSAPFGDNVSFGPETMDPGTGLDSTNGLPAAYTFTAQDAGRHVFDIMLRKAGTRTVRANDPANSVRDSDGYVTVNPAAPDRVAVVADFDPTTTPANAGLATQGQNAGSGVMNAGTEGRIGTPRSKIAGTQRIPFLVEVTDQFYNVVPSSWATVYLTDTDPYDDSRNTACSDTINPCTKNSYITFQGSTTVNWYFTSSSQDGYRVLSATGSGITNPANPSSVVPVVGGHASRLLAVMPGEVRAQGKQTGMPGKLDAYPPSALEAGATFFVQIFATDDYFNTALTDVGGNPTNFGVKASIPSDPFNVPTQASLAAENLNNGATTFFLVPITAGTQTVHVSTGVGAPALLPYDTVAARVWWTRPQKLQAIVAGMTAVPGKPPYEMVEITTGGTSGAPATLTAGGTTTLTVNLVDPYFNVVSGTTPFWLASLTDPNALAPLIGPTVELSFPSDPNIHARGLDQGDPSLATRKSLTNGTGTFSYIPVTRLAASSITARDTQLTGTSYAVNTATGIPVIASAPVALMVFVPGDSGGGESPAEGTIGGKLGSPGPLTAGRSYNLLARSVDLYNNKSPDTRLVKLTSSDKYAAVPAHQPLGAGELTFNGFIPSAATTTLQIQPVDDSGLSSSQLFTLPVASATVVPNVPSKMLVMLTGESPEPGRNIAPFGVNGTPATMTVGPPGVQSYVYATDANYNIVAGVDRPAVTLTADDPFAVVSGCANPSQGCSYAMNNGSFVPPPVQFHVAGPHQISVSDIGGLGGPYASDTVTLSPGQPSRLRVVMPSELRIAGDTGEGRTGPQEITQAGVSTTVVVDMTDDYRNINVTTPREIRLVATNYDGTPNPFVVVVPTSQVVGAQRSVDPVAGLAAHWDFDETAGQAAADVSGNGNTASLVAGVSHAQGFINEGVSFDGSSGYAQASVGTARTVSLWLKTTSSTQTYLLANTGSGGQGTSFALGLTQTHGVNGSASPASDAAGAYFSFGWDDVYLPSLNLADGHWHQLTASWDGGKWFAFAVDGAFPKGFLFDGVSWTALQPQPFTLPLAPAPANYAINIGGNTGSPLNAGRSFFAGSLDEVRLYDVYLTTSQIVQLYRSDLATHNNSMGSATFDVTFNRADDQSKPAGQRGTYLLASDVSLPPLCNTSVKSFCDQSSLVSVGPGVPVRLLIALDGEDFDQGSPTGKKGKPNAARATTQGITATNGYQPYQAKVGVMDSFFNLVPGQSFTEVQLHAQSDPYGAVYAPAAIDPATGQTPWIPLELHTATTAAFLSASEVVTFHNLAADVKSSTFTVFPTDPEGLQVLLPGQSAVPGGGLYPNGGVTGTISTQTAGTPFPVTVSLVDHFMNVYDPTFYPGDTDLPASGITVTLRSNDVYALPVSGSLANGVFPGVMTLVTKTSGTVIAAATAGSCSGSSAQGGGCESAFPAGQTSPFKVYASTAVALFVTLPGETLVQGKCDPNVSPYCAPLSGLPGKIGAPSVWTIPVVSNAFMVYLVDAFYNVVTDWAAGNANQDSNPPASMPTVQWALPTETVSSYRQPIPTQSHLLIHGAVPFTLVPHTASQSYTVVAVPPGAGFAVANSATLGLQRRRPFVAARRRRQPDRAQRPRGLQRDSLRGGQRRLRLFEHRRGMERPDGRRGLQRHLPGRIRRRRRQQAVRRGRERQRVCDRGRDDVERRRAGDRRRRAQRPRDLQRKAVRLRHAGFRLFQRGWDGLEPQHGRQQQHHRLAGRLQLHPLRRG